MFYIGFVSAPRVDPDGRRRAFGEITLDEDSPRFDADLGAWHAAEYVAQWKAGIARLAAGERSSALVTSYGGPGATEHEMWPMWRDGAAVVLQRRTVGGAAIGTADDVADVADAFYAQVGDRPSATNQTSAIQNDEWRMTLGQLLAFIADESP